MTSDPLGRSDRLQVKVAPAGWRGVLADPDGRTVWTCRHHHPTDRQARACAERERQVPGLADLGFRLRQLREAAGLSQAQAAQALECSDSKVSGIETGEVLPTPRDVRDLASLYRVAPAEPDALVATARSAREARAAWARQHGHGLQGLDQDQDGGR